MKHKELVAYINSFKAGERVVETSRSCQWKDRGTTYFNDSGVLCIKWDPKEYATKIDRETLETLETQWGSMGTSFTGGARRIFPCAIYLKNKALMREVVKYLKFALDPQPEMDYTIGNGVILCELQEEEVEKVKIFPEVEKVEVK